MTHKTFGTQPSGATPQAFTQARKRSVKASNSEYFAGPEMTTNKDATLQDTGAGGRNKEEEIKKHLQELNDRYSLHDQVQSGSILGLVKKKSLMLLDYVKSRTASAG